MCKKLAWPAIIFSFIAVTMVVTIEMQAENQQQKKDEQNVMSLRPQERFVDPRISPSLAGYIRDYFPLKFSGYIKQEAFYDTRQVRGVGDDQVLFFPEKKNCDPTGKDINAKGQGNMVAIETRLRATVEGPKIDSANSLGVIEADFFGFNHAGFLDVGRLEIVNVYRIRHAFVQLDWGKYRLTAGQSWHPMFVPTCFPETISFNSGAPIEPFSRNPQLRFTYRDKRFDIIAAALSQIRFFNDGPDGFSAVYLRNAVVPNLHSQVKIRTGEHLFGASFDYKRLVPRIKTNNNFKVSESINSIAAMWYACFKWGNTFLRTKLTYAENATNFILLGGYAVHAIDPVTDERAYTNLRVLTFWIDTATTIGNTVEPGMFIGFTKNLGSSKTIVPNLTDGEGNVTEKRIFGIGTDIKTVFRISPRLRWYIKKITAAGELEYTRAAYGTLDNKGKIQNTIPVHNVRFLFAIFYYF